MQVNVDCVWRAELLSKLERHAVEAKKEKQAKADYEVGAWDRTHEERRYRDAVQLNEEIDKA